MASTTILSPAIVEQGLYVAYASLAAMAIVPIYFGSFASLKKWKNPTEKKAITKRQIDESDAEDEEDAPSEVLSLQDAFMLPALYGSAALYGLNFAYKTWDNIYVNYALTAYFALLGVLATTQVGVNTLTFVTKLFGIKIDSYRINLVKKPLEFYSAKFTILHLAMLAGSVLLTAYYVATKNWIASNVFACSLAFSAIQILSLESFKAGITLLSGLFFYDVFWVYGSDAMASVAKNVDVPIKVLFPRLLLGLPAGQAFKFATLGLGDIVVPGLFIALCLRFDQHRAGNKHAALGRSTGFRKPYFIACLAAYMLGLGATFYIEHGLKIAQPVLWYLSPACVLSVLMTASVRGEMKSVLGYVSEEGLAVSRMKKESLERRTRQKALAQARARQAQASRYVSHASVNSSNRLPNVIKEESSVPAAKLSPEPTSVASATDAAAVGEESIKN